VSCRIDRTIIGEDLVVLRISGLITGENVTMHRASREKERSEIVINLKDALLVDREVVKLLALRESNGTELRNSPAYIREWVTRERAYVIALQRRDRGEDIDDVCRGW